MVDRTDIPKLSSLYGERNLIENAIKMFDEGGRIIAMTIGKQSEGDPQFWQFTTQVSTETMSYPPGMVEAIRSFCQQRLAEITQELTNLGVTGIA